MKKIVLFMVLCIVSPSFADSDEEYFLNRKNIEHIQPVKKQPKVTDINAFVKKGCHFIGIEIDNSGVYEIHHNPNCDNHYRDMERRHMNYSHEELMRINSSRSYKNF